MEYTYIGILHVCIFPHIGINIEKYKLSQLGIGINFPNTETLLEKS